MNKKTQTVLIHLLIGNKRIPVTITRTGYKQSQVVCREVHTDQEFLDEDIPTFLWDTLNEIKVRVYSEHDDD